MSKHRTTLTGLALAILLAAGMAPAWADRDDDRGRDMRRPNPVQQQVRSEHRERELDRRHFHNRYYPPRGVVVDALPRDHVVVPYRDTRYYFHSGVWYRPSGVRFVVVAPPIGLSVSLLPPYYTTIWVGGVPYYYADGVYYLWRPVDRTYVVVDPPNESEVVSLPPEPEQLFIYPKQGQSEQQQAKDRYDCHRWAVDQTAFDPTQPGGGVAPAETAGKRADYQRATKACLEARGYSVR
ncbi:MAG: DUF6515 family protein [Pseudomonadota bacterium]